jgi:hypothetical protein
MKEELFDVCMYKGLFWRPPCAEVDNGDRAKVVGGVVG